VMPRRALADNKRRCVDESDETDAVIPITMTPASARCVAQPDYYAPNGWEHG